MILSVENLTKTYLQGGHEIVALEQASFNLEAGKTLAIVGPSGSGKTTLLSLLAGLDDSTSGSVVVDGQNISQMSENDLTVFRSQKLGIIFQQFHLMPHLSALENVQLPLDIQGDPESQQKAIRALEAVGLSSRSGHLPKELSGGECQRVAIARAIITNPKILLADEPSGNLDTENGDMVMNLIFDLVSKFNMTLILVTHNLELANRCDRQIILKGGRVI